ncbi:MAG TPA: polyprenyl synthetase family protein [Kosmotogaceae bacterium]|nr:polyprenyl synthetase family protein [Kosmotogaceae bacterium]
MKILPLEDFRKAFDHFLLSEISDINVGDDFRSVLGYTFRSGGKRLRPYIIRCLCDELLLEQDIANSLGIAVEMFHTGSLIHDDLPSIDNDDLRRGNPSLHKAYGEDLALLAGDFLLIYPVKIILRSSISKNRVIRIIELWTKTSLAVIEGEYLDVTVRPPFSEDTVRRIHLKKTGELFGFCFASPILCCDDTDVAEKMLELGRQFGIAFQIADDIKDSDLSDHGLGKTPGKDAALSRPSALNAMNKIEARHMISEFIKRRIPEIPFARFRKTVESLTRELIRY